MSKETMKKYFLTGITILTLVEAYFYYRTLKDYIGIYQTSIFIPLLLQPILYRKLFMSDEKITLKNWKLSALLTVTLLLPVLIYFTLPEYTYEEGKEFVQEYTGDGVSFIEQEFQKRTIPVIGKKQGLFKSSRIYYYATESDEMEAYFIVDPLSGEVDKLDEDFFRTE